MSDMSEAPRLAPETVGHDPLGLLAGVTIRLSVEAGSAMLPLAELAMLEAGSVVALDRQVNTPLDICANGTCIARGEIVAVDGHYGIRVTELMASEKRPAGLERRT